MVSINTLVVLVFTTFVYVQGDSHANVDIIGGHQISIEAAPYIASLRLDGKWHYCGGSIIHERFILTAAHCIIPNREIKVLVGTNNIHKGGSLYNVKKIIVHPNYSNKTYNNDITLLELDQKLSFGSTVKTINLNNQTVKLRQGLMVNATGWGFTTPQGNVSTVLLQVKVPVISKQQCQKAYGVSRITSRMVCAGGRGRDSCKGDSGGPLTSNNVLVGITSWGGRCGNLPGVYTKVSPLAPWIANIINQKL